jgi:hypothetical protein
MKKYFSGSEKSKDRLYVGKKLLSLPGTITEAKACQRRVSTAAKPT